MAVINPFYIENMNSEEIKVHPLYSIYFWVGDNDYPTDDYSSFYYFCRGDGDGPISVPAGKKIYFASSWTYRTYDDGEDPINWFSLEKLAEGSNIRIGGSLGSLLHDGDGTDETPVDDYTFAGMFCDLMNLNLYFAEDFRLPAVLAPEYFYAAFGMTNIASIPADLFQATEIPETAYATMFSGCQGLEDVVFNFPKLTSVGVTAMSGMFGGSDISNVDAFLNALPTDVRLGEGCCIAFARQCNNIDSITIPNVMLGGQCFRQAFGACESLTTVKILVEDLGTSSADEWAERSFHETFKQCGNLNSIECHFTRWHGGDKETTRNWVEGVSVSGDFYCNEVTLDEIYDDSHIPEGWNPAPVPGPVPPVTFGRAHGTICIDGFAVKGGIDANTEGHYDLAGMNLAAEMGGKKGNSRGTIHFVKE